MNVFLSEFKRVLTEKKFIYIFIFLIFVFLTITSLDFIPMKMYGESISALNVWKNFLNSRIMTTFIVLFPTLIYCGSFGDDINTNFINHIILRTGFKKYFINKYLVTVFSGGILYFATSIISFFLSWMIFHINLQDQSLQNILSIKLFNTPLFGGNISYLNLINYSIVISFILFILGVIYASVGFLISLYTNNKMFIFGLSILSLRLYEDSIFTFSPILSPLFHMKQSKFYLKFSIFNDLGVYSNMDSIVNSLIMLCIIIFLIILRYFRFKKIYNEG